MKKGVDYIGVCVVFYCHDGKGNIVMHKRSQKCRDEQGRWDVGGGALEHGETFEEAVRREIKEEYCCDVKDIEFLGAHNVLREVNGQKTHWIALIHKTLVDPSQVKNGEPEYIEELGWFNIDKLPSPLHSQFQDAFGLYKNKLL